MTTIAEYDLFLVVWSGGYEDPGIWIGEDFAQAKKIYRLWRDDADGETGDTVALYGIDKSNRQTTGGFLTGIFEEDDVNLKEEDQETIFEGGM